MNRKILWTAVGVVVFVFGGFVPNAWTWDSFPFTVPENIKPTSFRGLPPGKYRSATIYWYWMQFGLTLNSSNHVVDFNAESHHH